MTLSRTYSADGIRYANADESFIFWGRGESALVLEDNAEKSYIGCIAAAPEPAGQGLSLVYANNDAGFSLRLPAGYAIDESYRYQELGPNKDIYGIKFTIPASVAIGTNLSADSYLSVEEIPQREECSAALFLDRAAARAVTDASTDYSVASTTGAAAGNRYEETVYALPGTNPCVAVRYYIHYGVFENYAPGLVREFDQQALLAQFDAMRRTLRIVQ
jgi:membrane-bound inhibitor of C-type lysozyme